MIVPTANYPTSRDYAKLWELAHTAAIACIVDTKHGEPDTCRDIARTVHSLEWSPELVQVGSRGICHVWAESLEAFTAQCEHCNLEWLVPPAPVAVPVVAIVRFEFEVIDEHDQTVASGDASTLEEAAREGQHYLNQYQQGGPCALELRRVEVLNSDAIPLPQTNEAKP